MFTLFTLLSPLLVPRLPVASYVMASKICMNYEDISPGSIDHCMQVCYLDKYDTASFSDISKCLLDFVTPKTYIQITPYPSLEGDEQHALECAELMVSCSQRYTKSLCMQMFDTHMKNNVDCTGPILQK